MPRKYSRSRSRSRTRNRTKRGGGIMDAVAGLQDAAKSRASDTKNKLEQGVQGVKDQAEKMAVDNINKLSQTVAPSTLQTPKPVIQGAINQNVNRAMPIARQNMNEIKRDTLEKLPTSPEKTQIKQDFKIAEKNLNSMKPNVINDTQRLANATMPKQPTQFGGACGACNRGGGRKRNRKRTRRRTRTRRRSRSRKYKRTRRRNRSRRRRR